MTLPGRIPAAKDQNGAARYRFAQIDGVLAPARLRRTRSIPAGRITSARRFRRPSSASIRRMAWCWLNRSTGLLVARSWLVTNSPSPSCRLPEFRRLRVRDHVDQLNPCSWPRRRQLHLPAAQRGLVGGTGTGKSIVRFAIVVAPYVCRRHSADSLTSPMMILVRKIDGEWQKVGTEHCPGARSLDLRGPLAPSCCRRSLWLGTSAETTVPGVSQQCANLGGGHRAASLQREPSVPSNT